MFFLLKQGSGNLVMKVGWYGDTQTIAFFRQFLDAAENFEIKFRGDRESDIRISVINSDDFNVFVHIV